jgi:ketosteroid isomerase-like protein
MSASQLGSPFKTMQTRPEKTTAVDLAAIRQLVHEFIAAYNDADIERVCALLTDGAVLMAPNEPAVSGVDDVRRRIESFFSGFTFNLRCEARQTEVLGAIAFERGSYTAFALLKKDEKGEPQGGYGEYILLFERQPDKSWRIAAFGTAAAQGVAPRNVAAPERLEEVVGGISDPETAYWCDKWADTMCEYLSPLVTPDIKRKLYN